MLSFACPTNELKDHAAKPHRLMKETVKSDEGKKAAANLATYGLSIDKYITNTVKESKLRKTGIFFQSIRKILMI